MKSLGHESLVVQTMLQTGSASIYDQEAFRHLLWVERKRGAQAGRSPLLLLVSLSNPKASARMSAVVSSSLFAGLRMCVREVDLVGWYEEARTVGAVLSQRTNPSEEALDVIAQRVSMFLARSVTSRFAEQLRVRVIRLGNDLEAHV